MKNICFIPLRKGSKSIPNKNVKLFKGKPLFCWCLETILGSNIASEMWVATNCDKVKAIIAAGYPSVHVFHRNEQNAQDTSPTIDVILEFLNHHDYHPEDRLLLFQATCPLTSIGDILKLKETLDQNKFDSLVACLRKKNFRWTDDAKPLDYSLFDVRPRRQDHFGFLVETGSFYVSKVGNLLFSKHLLSGKVGIVEVGAPAAIDIDEPVDWRIGEAYASYLEEFGSE